MFYEGRNKLHSITSSKKFAKHDVQKFLKHISETSVWKTKCLPCIRICLKCKV